jgi:hypothetical protein
MLPKTTSYQNLLQTFQQSHAKTKNNLQLKNRNKENMHHSHSTSIHSQKI